MRRGVLLAGLTLHASYERYMRAEATGEAYTLVSPEEENDARSIERKVGRGIERRKLEGFDYDARAEEPLEVRTIFPRSVLDRYAERDNEYVPDRLGNVTLTGDSTSTQSLERLQDRPGLGPLTPQILSTLSATFTSPVRVPPTGSTTDLDLIMSVQTAEQSIEIVERAPAVNMADTTVGDSFDLDFLESLPLATRDYQGAAAITANEPGRPSASSRVPSIRWFSPRARTVAPKAEGGIAR